MIRKDLIRVAIQNLDNNDFEIFVFDLLSRDLYPGLNPTSQSGDLGEDARTEPSTLFLHHDKWISVATSKQSGWGKVKKDCNRCKETTRIIDILVFVTAGNPRSTTIERWKKDVKETYKWDLEVRTLIFLASFANRPEYEDIVDQYLHIPPSGGDFIQVIVKQFEKETERAVRHISTSISGLSNSIQRAEVKRIEDQIGLGKPVLLTGEAGSGKSGIAYQLAKNAENVNKPVLFLDARRLGHVKSDTEIRNHLGIKGSLDDAIIRLAKVKGCRVIIDQLDNSIGLPVSELLIDLVIDVLKHNEVEVITISRKRESHEIHFLDKLSLQSGFVEINSNPLSSERVRKVLLELGVDAPADNLIEMGSNLLNLEIIGRIIQNIDSIDMSNILNEVDLWEEYINVIKDREGNLGDDIIGEAIRLANLGLKAENRTFILDYSRSTEHKRLESWNIIDRDHGRIYSFHHEKLQDYLYAFDATERGLSKQGVMDELGDSHRTRNIYTLIQDIYHRNDPTQVPNYLREAWNV